MKRFSRGMLLCPLFSYKKGLFRLIALAAVLIFTIAINAIVPLEAYSAKNASSSKAEIEMEVSAGFDGIARLGAYTPYRITLVNKGRAIEGEVQVEVMIDSANKTLFAKPFSLPEASVKELVINAPVYTARKNIVVKAVERGKTLKEIEFKFAGLIPPENKMIGVLSSDPAAYGFLNGIKVKGIIDKDYAEKTMIMRASGAYATSRATFSSDGGTVETQCTLVPVEKEEMPDDINVMNGFDILIISGFDTSTLSEKQSGVLRAWVEKGGSLILGTGLDWKKVYDPLPEALKKFKVTGAVSVQPPEELAAFSGTDFSGSAKLDMVTGEIGFAFAGSETATGTAAGPGADTASNAAGGQATMLTSEDIFKNDVIVGTDKNPIATKYVLNSGLVVFLAFDPAMEPFTGWQGKEAFWRNLLGRSTVGGITRGDVAGYYYGKGNTYIASNLTNQVPDDRQPPFTFMFVTIGAYILIIGPVMYMFLKRKDRRDLNWVIIPAASLLCLTLIYFVGFRTRYATAILNTASVITLDTEKQSLDILTSMGVFNNKRGDLRLTYSNDSNIQFDVAASDRRVYTSYPAGNEPEATTVSKLYLSDPINYELYDVSMWEPKNIQASQSQAFNGELVQSVEIRDGKFKAVIKNTTPFELLDAFLTIGSNFIPVGDILPGQEKPVEAAFDSKGVYKSFQTYLNAMYGRSYYSSNSALPADYRTKLRKRSAAESLLNDPYKGIINRAKIGLYALNYQDMGYGLEINNESPVTYNTNAVFYSTGLSFESGQEVDIPAGILVPRMLPGQAAEKSVWLDGDEGIGFEQLCDIDFAFDLPENIQPEAFSLKFGTILPLSVKYNLEDRQAADGNVQLKLLQNRYEYYLYNNSKDEWEKIESTHSQVMDASRYVDADHTLKVRVKVVELADRNSDKDAYTASSYVEVERLAMPEIQMKGVVK